MKCSFCDDPAAHPATGCQYGPNTLACPDCTRRFWKWARAHFNKKPRKGSSPETSLSFYEAASKRWTFVEVVAARMATLDDVHDWISTWHDSPSYDGPLHEHLGLTREQYALWVQSPKTLEASVEEQVRMLNATTFR